MKATGSAGLFSSAAAGQHNGLGRQCKWTACYYAIIRSNCDTDRSVRP